MHNLPTEDWIVTAISGQLLSVRCISAEVQCTLAVMHYGPCFPQANTQLIQLIVLAAENIHLACARLSALVTPGGVVVVAFRGSGAAWHTCSSCCQLVHIPAHNGPSNCAVPSLSGPAGHGLGLTWTWTWTWNQRRHRFSHRPPARRKTGRIHSFVL